MVMKQARTCAANPRSAGHLRGARAMYGFNIIELMTVLVIFGVLFALAIPEFRSYTQNTRMLAAAQGFFGALQQARAEAIRLNAPVQVILTDNDVLTNPNISDTSSTGKNWMVRSFNRGTASFDLVNAKSGTEGGTTGQVEISGTDAATNPLAIVEFNGLGGTTLTSVATFAIRPAAGQGTCSTSTDQNQLRCLNVVVTPGGRSQVCDPAVTAAADARRCIVS
jgi:type IV fimbrial biogenesis protein FimT